MPQQPANNFFREDYLDASQAAHRLAHEDDIPATAETLPPKNKSASLAAVLRARPLRTTKKAANKAQGEQSTTETPLVHSEGNATNVVRPPILRPARLQIGSNGSMLRSVSLLAKVPGKCSSKTDLSRFTPSGGRDLPVPALLQRLQANVTTRAADTAVLADTVRHQIRRVASARTRARVLEICPREHAGMNDGSWSPGGRKKRCAAPASRRGEDQAFTRTGLNGRSSGLEKRQERDGDIKEHVQNTKEDRVRKIEKVQLGFSRAMDGLNLLRPETSLSDMSFADPAPEGLMRPCTFCGTATRSYLRHELCEGCRLGLNGQGH